MQLNSVERSVKEISRRLKLRRFIVNNLQDLNLRFYKEKLVTLWVHVGLLFTFFLWFQNSLPTISNLFQWLGGCLIWCTLFSYLLSFWTITPNRRQHRVEKKRKAKFSKCMKRWSDRLFSSSVSMRVRLRSRCARIRGLKQRRRQRQWQRQRQKAMISLVEWGKIIVCTCGTHIGKILWRSQPNNNVKFPNFRF